MRVKDRIFTRMREKEFVPHEEALALKELGFDEKCLCNWEESWSPEPEHEIRMVLTTDQTWLRPGWICAPTFSQAFRWIREKYWYTALILCDSFQIVMQLSTSQTLDSKTWEWKPIYITQTYHREEGLKSYDESELACLKQLIKIAKEKNNEQR